MTLNTYAEMRLFEIKRKLFLINPEMKTPVDIDVVNLALVVFSIICDAHVNPELTRHEIAESMLEDKEDFIYYVNDLIEQTNNTNEFLNEYIDKKIELLKKEVK